MLLNLMIFLYKAIYSFYSNGIVNTLMAGFQEPVRVQFNSAENLEDLAGQLESQLMTDSLSL